MYIPVAQRQTTAGRRYIPVAERIEEPNTEPFSFNLPMGMQTTTPAFLPPETPTIQSMVGGFTKDVGQSIARNIASAGITIASAIAPKEVKPFVEPLKAEDFQSFFSQALVETVFGKKPEEAEFAPTKSIEQRIVEAEPKIKDWQKELTETLQTPELTTREKFVMESMVNINPTLLAFAGIMGSVGIDLTPFGGLEKNALRAMVKAKTAGEAIQVLTKMGVADDLARQFADDVVKVADEKSAKALFNSIANLQQTTKVTPKIPLRQAISDEYVGGYKKYLEEMKKIGSEPVSFQKWADFHSFQEVARGAKVAPKITPELQPLAQEAIPKELQPIVGKELKIKRIALTERQGQYTGDILIQKDYAKIPKERPELYNFAPKTEKGLIAHELGHKIENELPDKIIAKFNAIKGKEFNPKGYNVAGGREGLTWPEDFAESFSKWTEHYDIFKKEFPQRARFFDELGLKANIGKDTAKLDIYTQAVKGVEVPPIKPPRVPPTPITKLPPSPEPIADPIKALNEALQQAEPARGKLETAYTAERAKRIREVERAIDEIGGEKGYAVALSKLKGELAPEAKIAFTPIKDKLTQLQLDSLYNMTWKHPYLNNWEKIGAADGLTGLLAGEIPQPKQLVLLEEIYGTDLIKSILAKRALGLKIKDVLVELANLPRAIKTTADMSAFLRQGIVEIAAHPIISTKAMGKTFKFAFSPQAFKQYFIDLPKEKLYPLMRKSGLAITDPSRALMAGREEAFISRFLQKVPVVGQIVGFAERAYVGFLNKLRVDLFKHFADELLTKGFSPIKDERHFKAIANMVNTFTGRGSIGALNKITPELNIIFFSPRLISARFNALNPIWYSQMPKEIRKKALADFAKFVGVGLTTLALIKLSAGDNVDVEADPRSADSGKIRIGNTRFDIWGGFQQWARVFAQVVTGQRKNTTTGEIISLTKDEYPFTTRKEAALRFIEGKLAPIPALINELASGAKTFEGEDLDLKEIVKQNFIPMYIEDITEAYQDGGLGTAIGAGSAAFFGIGVQTYGKKGILPGLPALPPLPKIPKLPELPPLPKI